MEDRGALGVGEDYAKWWSAAQARLVLDEIANRLVLIRELETRGLDRLSKELEVIQPIFERGLWMLGHEYDGHGFHANEGISAICKRVTGVGGETDRRRPDLLLGFQRETFENGEPAGLRDSVLIELKRPGIRVGLKAAHQVEEYCAELIDRGVLVGPGASHVVFVIGELRDGKIGAGEKEIGGANVRTVIRTFHEIIADAKKRTFHTYEQLRRTCPSAEGFEQLFENLRSTP